MTALETRASCALLDLATSMPVDLMLKRADHLRTPDPYFSGLAGFVGSTLEQLHADMCSFELPLRTPNSVLSCHDAIRTPISIRSILTTF